MDIAANEILQALKSIDNKINQIDIRLINMEIQINTILKLRRENINKKARNINQIFDYPKQTTNEKLEEGSLDSILLNEYNETRRKQKGKNVVEEPMKDESE